MGFLPKRMKMNEYLTEPFETTKKRTEQLEEAVKRYRLQNSLLYQLLEKQNIKVPEAIVNYAEIDLHGEEAKIYADLESIQRRLDSLMDMLIQLRFQDLRERHELLFDQLKTDLGVADDDLQE